MEYKENMPISSWAEADRPREKLLKNGRHNLSDAELIAILLGSGNKNESALALSQRILNHVANDLNQLGKLTIADLIHFKGIGEAKAISIVAALELGRRRKDQNLARRTKIASSKDAFIEIYPQLEDLGHEEFWVLLLDRSNQVIKKINISKGGVSGTVVDARLVFKSAIESLASGIILVHNHPSGNLAASDEDIRITRNLCEGARLIDTKVLDHLIIAGKDFYSFADHGKML